MVRSIPSEHQCDADSHHSLDSGPASRRIGSRKTWLANRHGRKTPRLKTTGAVGEERQQRQDFES